jgi:hypothetical protein
MQKNIEERKADLEDKINSKARERDSYILKINEIQKELTTLLEQIYLLDPSKIRIMCPACTHGIQTRDDGKKILCEYCNGSSYKWAEIFKEDTNVKESK